MTDTISGNGKIEAIRMHLQKILDVQSEMHMNVDRSPVRQAILVRWRETLKSCVDEVLKMVSELDSEMLTHVCDINMHGSPVEAIKTIIEKLPVDGSPVEELEESPVKEIKERKSSVLITKVPKRKNIKITMKNRKKRKI